MSRNNKYRVYTYGLILLGLVFLYILKNRVNNDKPVQVESTLKQADAATGNNPLNKAKTPDALQTGIPAYVIKTLDYVRKNNKAPDGFVGGRVFQNREKRLPEYDNSSHKVTYNEWDVHPKKEGVNRGAERLITSAKDAYYTKDHYQTFTHIDETPDHN